MTFLVRHLSPTSKGLPIEIYVSSNNQAWANYEAIQADIFDHILTIIPEFGLRVFQEPTGADFAKMAYRPRPLIIPCGEVLSVEKRAFNSSVAILQNTLLLLPESIAKIVFMAGCSLKNFRNKSFWRPSNDHAETIILNLTSPAIRL